MMAIARETGQDGASVMSGDMASDTKTVGVLIVSDNRSYIDLLREMLPEGWQADSIMTENPPGLIGSLSLEPYGCVLVDDNPESNGGAKLVSLIRRAENLDNRGLPIVLLTPQTGRDTVQMAIGAGVDEVMFKPVTVNELASRLTMILETPRPRIRAGDYFGPDRRRGMPNWDRRENRRGCGGDAARISA